MKKLYVVNENQLQQWIEAAEGIKEEFGRGGTVVKSDSSYTLEGESNEA